jgi:hypothetical protein
MEANVRISQKETSQMDVLVFTLEEWWLFSLK